MLVFLPIKLVGPNHKGCKNVHSKSFSFHIFSPSKKNYFGILYTWNNNIIMVLKYVIIYFTCKIKTNH